ncbi:four-carbon acid sugar kinase family protein, partial [Paenibacillus sp. TAF58]
VYDTFRPDFVIIAPAYPETGRLVREGRLYVHGKPLHETEFANDPKTPVTESYIPDLLHRQTKQPVEVIPSAIIAEGTSELELVLQSCISRGIRYLLIDSADGEDLRRTVSLFGETTYKVVWVGSAGLARQLANQHSFLAQPLT